MRLDERSAVALAKWASAPRVRVRELERGEHFLDASGREWVYLGGLRARLARLTESAMYFPWRTEVVRIRRGR